MNSNSVARRPLTSRQKAQLLGERPFDWRLENRIIAIRIDGLHAFGLPKNHDLPLRSQRERPLGCVDPSSRKLCGFFGMPRGSEVWASKTLAEQDDLVICATKPETRRRC